MIYVYTSMCINIYIYIYIICVFKQKDRYFLQKSREPTPHNPKKEAQQLGSSYLLWVIFIATQTSSIKFDPPMKKGAVM